MLSGPSRRGRLQVTSKRKDVNIISFVLQHCCIVGLFVVVGCLSRFPRLLFHWQQLSFDPSFGFHSSILWRERTILGDDVSPEPRDVDQRDHRIHRITN
jgi:hypothetical protein